MSTSRSAPMGDLTHRCACMSHDSFPLSLGGQGKHTARPLQVPVHWSGRMMLGARSTVHLRVEMSKASTSSAEIHALSGLDVR